MLHQTTDERGRREKKEREKGTVQRKSQVAGVREETERIEARRNRGIGRRKEETGEVGVCVGGRGGIELSLKVFLCRSR